MLHWMTTDWIREKNIMLYRRKIIEKLFKKTFSSAGRIRLHILSCETVDPFFCPFETNVSGGALS